MLNRRRLPGIVAMFGSVAREGELDRQRMEQDGGLPIYAVRHKRRESNVFDIAFEVGGSCCQSPATD